MFWTRFMAGLPLLCAMAALAGPGEPLEEVVVSGFRVVPARETGLSLSLMDQQDIEQAAVTHLEELIPLVPNLNLSGEGSRARYLQVRGVGEREQYEGAPNPSVGLYIDDIDLSGIGSVASVFDMQTLEVLRGPQSTRFGGSALAGVIYARTADPEEARHARLVLNVGDDDLGSAGVSLGGSLGGDAQGRLSLYQHRSNGFRHNDYLRTATNDRDEQMAHGKLAWTFADDWRALLALFYADNDNGYDAWTVRNDAVTHSDNPGKDTQATIAGSLRLEHGFDAGFELVSITSLARTDILFSFDGDWGNPQFWEGYGDYVYDYSYRNPRERDTLTQELRLVSEPGAIGGHTDWVAGVFWRQLDEGNVIDSTGIYDDRLEENFCAPCLTGREVDSSFASRNLALFAGTETTLADRWTLSLGLRLEQWEARYEDEWRDINYPVPPGGGSCSQFDCRPDDLLWGGHASLGHDLTPRLRAYARLARGFKAGGFNPSLAALQGVAMLGPEFVSYAAETLTSYELGLKADWLSGALAADVAVFRMDRRDAQLSQSSQQVPFDPNSFVFVTFNGVAEVHGLEAGAHWQLTPSWNLHGALGLLGSEIGDSEQVREVSPGAVQRELAHAPAWTVLLGASYAGTSGWFARADLNAMDRFYFDISHDQRADRRSLLNLRVGRQWRQWTLSAWVRNLTDETYFTRGFYFGTEPPGFAPTLYTRFGDPRQAGLSLEYRLVDD